MHSSSNLDFMLGSFENGGPFNSSQQDDAFAFSTKKPFFWHTEENWNWNQWANAGPLSRRGLTHSAWIRYDADWSPDASLGGVTLDHVGKHDSKHLVFTIGRDSFNVYTPGVQVYRSKEGDQDGYFLSVYDSGTSPGTKYHVPMDAGKFTRWHHVVLKLLATSNSQDTISLFIDGAQKQEATRQRENIGETAAFWDRRNDPSTTDSNSLHVWRYSFWYYALSAEEIHTLATTASDPDACVACEANCDSCTDNSTCTTCSADYFLKNSDCVTSDNCGTGFFADTFAVLDACAACEENCDACTDASTCTTCSADYFLKESYCVTSSNCGTGFFANTAADPDACATCEENCDACTDTSTCTTCSADYFLKESNCVTSDNCGAGFFADTAADPDACTACEENCDACTDTSTCTTCSADYFLKESNCVTSGNCGAGFFADTAADPDACAACEENCDACTDTSTCTTCSADYFLKESNCVTSEQLRRRLLCQHCGRS